MNWEAIGAIGEIIGALAVFLTLAYLAIQIRQNTKAVRASAIDSSVNAMQDIRKVFLEHVEITDLYLKGSDNPEDLNQSESMQYRLLLTNIMWSGLNLYTQSKYAGLSESLWESNKHVVKRVLNTNGGIWYWSAFKHEYDKTFVQEIDKIISNSKTE